MPKYDAARYRCNVCGDHFHTEAGRDRCEASHGGGQ